MSKLLLKVEPKDNADFAREMQRQKKEENVANLVDWLHQEAAFRSRGKKEIEGSISYKERGGRRTDHHANDANSTKDDESCPLGCKSKHLLASCPVYQGLTVNEKWEVVKENKRCRKCLRVFHHTNDCTKADGTTCDKCKRNHHRSLHNEKKVDSSKSNLDPDAPAFNNRSPDQAESKNNSVQGRDNEGANDVKNVPGVCPVQKIRVRDSEGNLKTLIAMLDTGSNKSFV